MTFHYGRHYIFTLLQGRPLHQAEESRATLHNVTMITPNEINRVVGPGTDSSSEQRMASSVKLTFVTEYIVRSNLFLFEFVSRVVQSLCLVTRQRDGRPDFDSQQGKTFSQLLSIQAMGPTQSPAQWVSVTLFPAVNLTSRESNQSSPASVEVRKEMELYFHTYTSSRRGSYQTVGTNLPLFFR